jgi:hypothetical protein
MEDVERLAEILTGDRVLISNTPLCGTVLLTNDEFALVAVDNTQHGITLPIEQLRLIGH